MVSVGAMVMRDIAPSDVTAHVTAIAPGLDELWVVEDLPFAGGISQVANVLQATAAMPNLMVGHGIAPAPFRNPATLAMEWATLAALYPGRLSCGIGHGLPHWMRQIGASVDSPMTLLQETTSAVMRLLSGEPVDTAGRYVRLDDVGLEFPPAVVPPVALGVSGPNGLRLSGAIANGTVLCEGNGAKEIRKAKSAIDAGREAADRSDPHRLTVFAGFYCGDPAGLGPPPPDAPSGWACITEHPEQAIDELGGLIDAGADAVILVPFATDRTAQLCVAAETIAPALR